MLMSSAVKEQARN